MAKTAPTFRAFLGAGLPAVTERKERAAFVKELAGKLGVTPRTVQRRITETATQTRGQSKPITKQERSTIRQYFKENPRIDKIENKAARTDKGKYRLATEQFDTKEKAEARMDEMKEGLARDKQKGDSPTLADHANVIDLFFVPEGGKYVSGPERNSAIKTAGEGGQFVLTMRAD